MNLHSDQIDQIATALAKAQGMIEGAEKRANNPHYGKKYADLYAVWDACREPLSTNGLSVTQIPTETDNGMMLITMLMHSSGQWISARYPVRPVKTDPQGYGSAISYARRYTLMAVVGIAPEEDDGNAASGIGNNFANRDDCQQQRAPANQPEVDDKAIMASFIQAKTLREFASAWERHEAAIKLLLSVKHNAVLNVADQRTKELVEAGINAVKSIDGPDGLTAFYEFSKEWIKPLGEDVRTDLVKRFGLRKAELMKADGHPQAAE